MVIEDSEGRPKQIKTNSSFGMTRTDTRRENEKEAVNASR
jgi:hypothetical protein